jgi:hypothetical protein
LIGIKLSKGMRENDKITSFLNDFLAALKRIFIKVLEEAIEDELKL